MALLHNNTILKWMNTHSCLVVMVVILSNTAFGQTNRYLQQGNQFYDQKKYKEAADDYARALKREPNNTSGLFNLGNSLYQQQKFDSSRKIMAATEKSTNDKKGKAAANYNIGNSYMSEKKWEDAINSYKQTLRNNPEDADAKYNLSYAQEMLKKQQEQDKQNKDQKDKDKDKQDQKNKDQKKDKQDKQDKDKKDDNGEKDDKNKEPKEGQNQSSKLSQQQAENMLNTLQQQEKKLEEKINKEKGVPVKLQKDW